MPLKKGIPMEDKKNKPKKKQIYTVLMLICVVVFLFALYKVVTIIMDYKAIDDYYDKANEEFVTIEDDGQKINVDSVILYCRVHPMIITCFGTTKKITW